MHQYPREEHENHPEEHELSPKRHRHEHGWLRLLFLRLIHEKPIHGYQIMDELSKRGLVESTRLEAGTVYTLLRRLEHHGLVSSEWEETEAGPNRRVYKITPEGVTFLKSAISSLVQSKLVLDELLTYYETKLKIE